MTTDRLSINDFQTPQVAYRPWTRWWWPGGDVEIDELRREVKLFADTMFGGAEIQPFAQGIHPDTLNDPSSAIYDYDSPAYYQKMVAVLEAAREQGIQIDLTVGSGWPPGGEFVPLEDNTDTLLYGEVSVTHAVNMPLPPPEMPFAYAIFSPDSILPLLMGREWVRTLSYRPETARLVAVVAARMTDNGRSPDPSILTDTLGLDLESALDISDRVVDGHLQWEPPSPGEWQVIAIYTMPSGSSTLISAMAGENYAVDPFDSEAITRFYDNWLGSHPEVLAFAGTTLRALFSDSYEYFAQRHFADDFIDLFRANRGYDITPYLPAVFQPARDQHFFFFSGLRTAPDYSFGALGERLIHDYDLTVSDLFFKHWYPASREWAQRHDLQFRQQGYNPPLDVIKAAGAAHLPETEGGNERLLKRVASGGHLYGRPLISAESFVFYPPGGYALTPQDYKQGIDVLMTAGVNQIFYHGTPYRWDKAGYGEPGWSPFISPYSGNISTNISEADSFWKYQGELNTYAARLHWLLRQGAPDADLLVYLPLFAKPTDPDFAPVLETLDASGYAWEWVNDELLAAARWTESGLVVGDMTFQGIVLSNVTALPPETAQQLAALAQAGAPVVVFGHSPVQQPGYLDYEANDQRVADHVQTVVNQAPSAHITDLAALTAFVRALPTAPISFATNSSLRHIRRRLDAGGHLAFVRNTSEQATTFTLAVSPALRVCCWLDASDGNIYQATPVDGELTGWLPGFGAITLVGGAEALFAADELADGNPVLEPVVSESLPLDNWTLEVAGEDVPGGHLTLTADALGDWAEHDDLKHVSSPGSYTTTVTLTAIDPGQRTILDLGAVFGAADVVVNDQVAGHAIYSPWQVEITDYLVVGDNRLVVTVTPALRNRFLGKGLRGDPKYAHFVRDRMRPPHPIASGLAGPVTIHIVKP